MKRSLYLVAMLLFFAACKDKEVIIPDNEAPPDPTVTDVVLESYINRSYIILLGHQPDDAEMSQGKVTLRAHNVSQADREAFLGGVMAQPGYAMRMFDVGRSLLINATDTTEIRQEIMLYQLLLLDSGYIALWPFLQQEIDDFEAVLAIPTDLAAGTVDMRGVHKRLVSNQFYDDINMGTQNFVLSMFENLLDRYPTEAERVASETMVDGFSAIVFMESGRNKADFIDIFFRSRDYDEGQVRDLFSRYLYRNPTTQELESLSVAYRTDNDYKALQMAVMSNDEFIGL
jgi:hypothetical protein